MLHPKIKKLQQILFLFVYWIGTHRKRIIFIKKSLVFVTSLLLISSLFFSGCNPDTPITGEQEEWVEQIGNWYPDDEITYVGHTVGFLGSRNSSAIVIRSENFPDMEFEVYEKNDMLYSTYTGAYHKEAVEDYYKETLDGFFRCDKLKVDYIDPRTKALPCEYISDEEFIEKYAEKKFSVYLTYKSGTEIPAQDEIVSSILKYIDSIGGDCDLDFYICRSSRDREILEKYIVGCNGGHIRSLSYKSGDDPNTHYKSIIKDEDLSEALKKYT